MSPRIIQVIKQNYLICKILPAGHSPSTTVTRILIIGNLLMKQSLLPSSDSLTEYQVSILMATSAFLFIHSCQSSQLNFSSESKSSESCLSILVDSIKRLRQISRAEIKLILTVQLTTVDQLYGLKINLKCYILIILSYHFHFSPENSLWDDFN